MMLAGAILTAGLVLGISEPRPSLGAPPPATSPILTEAALQRALPKSKLVRMKAASFHSFAATHAADGRLLSGQALATAVATANAGTRSAADRIGREHDGAPRPDSSGSAPGTGRVDSLGIGRKTDQIAEEGPPPAADPCIGLDSLRAVACRDSLAEAAKAEARRFPGAGEDPAIIDLGDPAAEERAAALDDTRTQGYFAQFIYDWGRGGSKDSDWDMDDWAAVVYVVVGVVVVGAFVVFGGKALYDLATNKDHARIFKEVGLRVSYSGTELEASGGSSLYREAYLMGLRFAFGLEQSVGLALTVEGGYIDLALRGLEEGDYPVDFRGGYLVGGPMVRFGRGEPLSISFEFLNGTSDHASIGWISKARMALQTKLASGALVGAHIGAVFYDLRYYDGLVARRGDFNRDLSLVIGMDAGWGF